MKESEQVKKVPTMRDLVSEFEVKLSFFSDVNFKHLQLNEIIESRAVIEKGNDRESKPSEDLGLKQNLERCLGRMDELLGFHLANTERTSELIG